MPTAQPRLLTIPRHRDPIADCAAAVIAHFAHTLPDLRRGVILMPHRLQEQRLRRCLLEYAAAHGHTALLPPTIATFHTLFLERAPNAQPALSAHERRLLLASELDEHPDLLPRAGRWEFADQLLQLFDDIDAACVQEPPPEAVTATTAHLVQTLHRAWREDRVQTPDVQALYRNSLRDDTLTHLDEHIFLCGFSELSACESAWAARLHEQERLTLIVHAGGGGRYATPALKTAGAVVGTPPEPPQADNALGELLDIAFASEDTVAARARAAADRFATSPAAARIRVFKPESLEQHAFGIYVKIRDWLDAGISPIAVVSQDRKLSRRLRAVLERADIPLCDHAGWALSTTASAAAVAALLPSPEQGFGGDVVLTLACSPYCRYGMDVVHMQQVCAYLERKTARLEPFRDFDETVAALLALNCNNPSLDENIQRVVKQIRDALDGLRRALSASGRRPLTALFHALFETMEALGMTKGLRKDAAGQRLLEELEAMAAAAHTQRSDGDWRLWRRWILHTLEHENFTPKEHAHLVEFYGLSQSSLARPAGLIVAALDANHTLPAEPLQLLDEDARRALGLKGRKWRIAVQHERFRTALESTEHVLLSCQHTDNGQTLTPAPWLDGLQHFHALAYGDDLEERDLNLRAQAEMRAAAETIFEDTPTRAQMPMPRLPAWPERLSASAVQAAVVCPYRFFAKISLNLAPVPTADDYDSARSYGIHLHRCLAALHTNMDKAWTEEHREHALELARTIVEAEFAPYLERHYSVAERMQKALHAVGWYVGWLIENTVPGAQFETETKRETTLAEGLQLHGRLDCVIHKDADVHIVDYKSGRVPSKKEVAAGEDVQLAAYALLYDKVEAVSYLDMKKGKPTTLAGEKLDLVREQMRQRLKTFKQDAADKPLPAWADDKDCKHCDYPGVCRRNAWHHTT